MTGTGLAKARADLLKAKSIVSDTLDADDIVIGKDILELISSAMYIDPMTVYREYVQNAADAIDDARETGVLADNELGTVEVFVDPSTRSVRIRDNGTGIAPEDFARRLTSIGASGKRGTSARGFRGVGRLAGLGYCQELVFRSRSSAVTPVSELRWDCRSLKASLRQAEDATSIAELISGIVTLVRIPGTDFPEHFFEVELKGIIRLRSDRLMSPSGIADYLGEVAPVPFAPEFRFGKQIVAALRDQVQLGGLDIRVNGIERPVYRPHRDKLTLEDGTEVNFNDLQLLEIPGIDGDCAAIAWVLHHEYDGALPTATQVRGLRLRSGNVQIGDHALLEELFPEPRFNVWSVGEIHVLDRQITPNGRRDHFEQNAHYNNLINHLSPLAREIAKKCRTSSVQRKWLREFEIHRNSAAETVSIIAQRTVPSEERQRMANAVEQNILQLEKISGMEVVSSQLSFDFPSVIGELRTELAEAMSDEGEITSPLLRLPDADRKTYEHFFELIYQCSVNRIAAKSLIDRILQKVT